MTISIIALGAWTAFALLRFVVVPQTDRRADANRNIGGIRAAAVSSLSGFLSIASLMVAISTTTAWGVLAYVNATGGTTLQAARDAQRRIQEIDAFFGNFDAGIGIGMTVALIAALAYYAYRSGGKRLAAVLNEHIGQEISRLQDKELEELPPTEEMGALAATIEALECHLAEIDEKDAARDRLLVKRHELVQQYHALDLLRRIDTSLNEPETVEESGFARVLLFFSSIGMLRSLKGLGRVTVTVGLLLLLPASMTIGLTGIQDATKARVLALNETVEQLELKLDGDGVDEEYELLVANAEPGALSPEDEQAIEEIASIFESEVVQVRYLQGARALRVNVAHTPVRAQVRSLILDASVSHPTARSQSLRSPQSLEPLEQRVLALNVEATGLRRPVTSYGERFRADLRETVSRMDRGVWADVRNNVGNYVRSFRQAPDPRDLRAMMLSDALGHVMGGVNVDSPIEQLLQRGTVELTGDLVEATYRTESRRFMVALTQSQDITQALSSLSRAPYSMRSTAMRQLRISVERLPAPENIPVSASLSVTPRSGVDQVAAQSAVQRIAQIRGTPSASVADALISFGDLFPGQPNEPVNSIRGRVVSTLAPSASGADLRTRYARARSYTRLRGFSRIGGVILGRPPESGTLEAQALEWRLTDRGTVLRLIHTDDSYREFGPYDPAIVHNALTYAADGRVTTVTMVTAEPLSDLRILLHPALVDTGLGCSAIQLDQLVDAASGPNQSLGDLRKTAIADVEREHDAYERAWAIRLRELSSRRSTRRHYAKLGHDLRQFLSDHALQITDSDVGIAPELAETGYNYLSSSPEFYDQRLVDALGQCGSSESVKGYDRCIRSTATTDAYVSDSTASWAAPPPQYVQWSGVREQPWAVDEALSFMTSQEPLGPFRFMEQIAFTSPPWFISEGRWYADNAVLESFDDETPYEITSLEQPLMGEIASHAEQDAETARVLARMAEFTHLQRLFRAALDGQLVLTGMDLEDLAGLAIETAPYVNRSETLRWLPGDYSIEELARAIIAPDSATADSLVTTLRNQIAGLKESLGLDDEQIALAISQGVIPLDEQMALAIGLGEQMCPAPGTFP